MRREERAAALREVEAAGLRWHIEVLGEDHFDLYFFRHEHMRAVLVQLLRGTDRPTFDAWAWGHAYGYSEEAIAEFISAKKEV
ncbi:MAG: hypothetical protein FJ087_07950 [Deltaproteobacteria bacterium]|nr:hypothetical protein [Deltaproteobacteria bacterium]